MSPHQIAQVCHEANREYCRLIGDYSQEHWDRAEQWQRDSAVRGVEYALSNPEASASAQHEAWLADKLRDGWKYGSVKDPEKKEHPCCVPYDELPVEQRRKDSLFKAVVKSLS
ncbi:MAG: hypothetical protein KGL39_47150 [Patescibacteria group bacterium]|nr:hypothetical protein [Patescibacteria group bacterium]